MCSTSGWLAWVASAAVRWGLIASRNTPGTRVELQSQPEDVCSCCSEPHFNLWGWKAPLRTWPFPPPTLHQTVLLALLWSGLFFAPAPHGRRRSLSAACVACTPFVAQLSSPKLPRNRVWSAAAPQHPAVAPSQLPLLFDV